MLKVIVYGIIIYAGFKYGIIQDMVHLLAQFTNYIASLV